METNYIKISELDNCEHIENTIIPVTELNGEKNYDTKKISYSNLSSNIYSNVKTEFINFKIDKVTQLDKCSQNDTISCMTGGVGYELKNQITDINQKIQNVLKKDQNETITGSWQFNSIPKTTQTATNDNDLTNLKTVKSEVSKIQSSQFVKFGAHDKKVTAILIQQSSGTDTGNSTLLSNIDPGVDYYPYKINKVNKFKLKKINEIIYITESDSLVIFSVGAASKNRAHIFIDCPTCQHQSHETCIIGSSYHDSKYSNIVSVYAKQGSQFYIYYDVASETDDDGIKFFKQVTKTFPKDYQIIITEIPVNPDF